MGASSSRRYVVFQYRKQETGNYNGRIIYPPPDEFTDSEADATSAYNMCVNQNPKGHFILVLFERDRKTKIVSWTVLQSQHISEIPIDGMIAAYQSKFDTFS